MPALSEKAYPHDMLREIHEQPDSLARTLAAFTHDQGLELDRFMPGLEELAGKQRMLIAASGSSRHAGLVGEIMIEDLSGLPVDVEYSGEYIYRSTRTLSSTCLLVLSQSGETADTLKPLREARAHGMLTIAITNRDTSSMSQLADCSLPTLAGIERAVPATKSFTAQLLILHLLALFTARMRGCMTGAVISNRIEQLRALPMQMVDCLPAWEAQALALADALKTVEMYFFLGRGIHYPIAREGALKLKESAYLAAEGYPAGELKHGPNALVGSASCLIVLATKDPASSDSLLRYQKTVQLLRDIRKQDARVVALANNGDDLIPSLTDETIFVPECAEHLAPILEVVPLQLLAYASAVRRGINMDVPRNRAKAVVVE